MKNLEMNKESQQLFTKIDRMSFDFIDIQEFILECVGSPGNST